MSTSRPRAIGIVRQSVERDGSESPAEQAARIRDAAEREGLELIDVLQELDVSGGADLASRPGLGPAVAAIEAGEAEVVIGAYFDRLFRSLRVQAEVVERVEAAGGRVLTVDVGQVSNGSAGQWLSAGVLGLMSEYQRRSSGERARAAVVRRVAEGVVPWKVQTPGLGVDEDGRLVATSSAALQILERALELRASGATIRDVRAFLLEHGIERSYHGVQQLLRDRLLVGEIHFGELQNLTAHAPFVDPVTFERAQELRVGRAPRAQSDALLARLGVLRCGTCGSAMVVGSANHQAYRIYRCSPTSDCPRRVTISAELAEAKVVKATIEALADVEGRASAASTAVAARAAADRLQATLDELIAALTASGLLSEPSAVEQLTAARVARDGALEQAERLAGASSGVVVSVADWDLMGVDERRELIRSTVRATVVPATGGRRGADRVLVETLGQ